MAHYRIRRNRKRDVAADAAVTEGATWGCCCLSDFFAFTALGGGAAALAIRRARRR